MCFTVHAYNFNITSILMVTVLKLSQAVSTHSRYPTARIIVLLLAIGIMAVNGIDTGAGTVVVSHCLLLKNKTHRNKKLE